MAKRKKAKKRTKARTVTVHCVVIKGGRRGGGMWRGGTTCYRSKVRARRARAGVIRRGGSAKMLKRKKKVR